MPTAHRILGTVLGEWLERDGSSARLPLVDALGSTLALLDASGQIVSQSTYEPFGAATTSGEASSHLFTGREDDGTGLYYYRARYYSPPDQRFIAQDPINVGDNDTNLYSYVGNDPEDGSP